MDAPTGIGARIWAQTMLKCRFRIGRMVANHINQSVANISRQTMMTEQSSESKVVRDTQPSMTKGSDQVSIGVQPGDVDHRCIPHETTDVPMGTIFGIIFVVFGFIFLILFIDLIRMVGFSFRLFLYCMLPMLILFLTLFIISSDIRRVTWNFDGEVLIRPRMDYKLFFYFFLILLTFGFGFTIRYLWTHEPSELWLVAIPITIGYFVALDVIYAMLKVRFHIRSDCIEFTSQYDLEFFKGTVFTVNYSEIIQIEYSGQHGDMVLAIKTKERDYYVLTLVQLFEWHVGGVGLESGHHGPALKKAFQKWKVEFREELQRRIKATNSPSK
jgi:hypothetical protein